MVSFRAVNARDAEMLAVMGSLHEHAFEGLDRDAALEIAEQSHKANPRVPRDRLFLRRAVVVRGVRPRRLGRP